MEKNVSRTTSPMAPMTPTMPTIVYCDGVYRVHCAFDVVLYDKLCALRRELGVERFRVEDGCWVFTEKAIVRRVREILPTIALVSETLHPAIAYLRTLKGRLPFTFYPFQEEAMKRIWDNDGNLILAAEPGCGKTVVAVAYGMSLPGQILVVCQKVNRLQWAKVIRQMSGDDVLVVTGTGAEQKAQLRDAGRYRWVIISYETGRTQREELAEYYFDLMIVDESHFLMTQSAQRTMAIYGGRRALSKEERESLGLSWAQRFTWEPGILTRRTLNLTGTPFKSKAKQMWTQLHAIDPHRWDNEEEFNQRYCAPQTMTINRGVHGYSGRQWYKNERQVTTYNGVSNAAELHREIAPYVYRITFEEALPHLPPIVRNDLVFTLEPEERREYERIVEDMAGWLDEQPARPGESEEERLERIARTMSAEALVRVTYLRTFMAKAKARRAVEVLESAMEAEEGALVFCNYKEPLRDIAETFAKRKVKTLLLTGDESDKKREEAKAAFRSGEIPFLLLSFGAGGTGLDGLQERARIVVLIDEAWEPNENTQAIRRAQRNGQRDSVSVYTLLGEETVDEYVHEKLDIKGEGFSQVMDGKAGGAPRQVSMMAEVLKGMRAQAREIKARRKLSRTKRAA